MFIQKSELTEPSSPQSLELNGSKGIRGRLNSTPAIRYTCTVRQHNEALIFLGRLHSSIFGYNGVDLMQGSPSKQDSSGTRINCQPSVSQSEQGRLGLELARERNTKELKTFGMKGKQCTLSAKREEAMRLSMLNRAVVTPTSEKEGGVST